MTFDYTGYILLPLLIFFARIIDVSIGTIRIIFISKDMKYLAPILGFFEILIWIIAINKIMAQASNFFFYIAYAGGFSAGTLIGMNLEKKFSFGKVLLRIITSDNPNELIEKLNKSNIMLTIIDGDGKNGKVKIIFSIIDRKKLKRVLELIDKHNPKAFYSVEDVRFAKDYLSQKPRKFFGIYRKGK